MTEVAPAGDEQSNDPANEVPFDDSEEPDPEQEVIEQNEPVRDLEPYINQLAPSTRKILDEEFHANFIHLIPPKQK